MSHLLSLDLLLICPVALVYGCERARSIHAIPINQQQANQTSIVLSHLTKIQKIKIHKTRTQMRHMPTTNMNAYPMQ